MVDRRTGPRQYCMTLVARFRRRNVVCAFPGRHNIVVTVGACAHALRVVELQRWSPFRWCLVMARLADVAGVQALVVFSGLAANVGERPGMAVHTICRNRSVIDVRRLPRRRRMTGIAILRNRNMVLTLTAC